MFGIVARFFSFGIVGFIILFVLANTALLGKGWRMSETTFLYLSVGCALFGAFGWPIVQSILRNRESASYQAASVAQEQANWQRNFDRTNAENDARNRSTLALLSGQVALLAQHKREGLVIENQAFELRQKLLELERTENSAMIQDLKRSLDNI